MAVQPGLFDFDERYAALSRTGDPLERLAAVVDFEVFRADLDPASTCSAAGRSPRRPSFASASRRACGRLRDLPPSASPAASGYPQTNARGATRRSGASGPDRRPRAVGPDSKRCPADPERLRLPGERQFMDLSIIVFLHVDRRTSVDLRVLAEDRRRALQQLAAPLRDLVRMHIKLLGQLGQRLFPLMAAIATFALKAGLWFRRGRFVMVAPRFSAIFLPISSGFTTQKFDSKVPVACDPAGHELDHGDLEEGSDGLGSALDVAGQGAVDAGPCEGALDDPSLGLDDETGVVRLMISTGRGAAAATRGPW